MAEVYRCNDTQSGHDVALKTFREEYLSLRPLRERFLDETINWISLGHHPNIVRALTLAEVNDPPQPCIVLEWIDGRYEDADASLATLLNRRNRRPLGFSRSLAITIGVVRGMRFACERLPGFVHGDLKPENILIDRGWRPHITDLGMSRCAGMLQTASSSAALSALIFPGTPGYCAPERYDQGHPSEQRSDIYALGCILFEMLTGQRLNPGTDEETRKQFDQQGKLREIPGALPESMRNVIAICTATNPDDRYGDWAQLEDALQACYRECTGEELPVDVSAREADTQTTGERAEALLTLGRSLHKFGDNARAIDFIDQGLDIASTPGFAGLRTRLLYQRAVIQLAENDPASAADALSQAESSLAGQDANELRTDILAIRGMLYAHQGDFEQAIGTLNQALQNARSGSDRSVTAIVLGNLGSTYGQAGEPGKAIGCFNEVLQFAEETGDAALRAQTLASLGVAHYDLEDYPRAIEYLERALELHSRHGDDPGRLHVLAHLWQSHAALGDPAQSREYHDSYKALASQLNQSPI